MRGIMGVGTNRINKYTLGKSTQGLSDYLLKHFPDEQVKVVIAYDCRNNSDTLARTVAEVFSANGIKVFLFSSLRTTPELSYAVKYLDCHSGIVLTASHNPPEYNGYKVYWQDGGQLVPPQDGEIVSTIDALNYSDVKFDANDDLIEWIDEKVDQPFIEACVKNGSFGTSQSAKDDLSIVFTSLHGTSIKSIPQTLEQAGYKNVHIVKEQAEPDGNFPTVKSPNPEEKAALKMATDLAIKVGADILIGTDPDSDRLGIAVRDNLNFIGGGEESYGFMVGDFVRDKDAVTSTLLACEIAAQAKANGSSVYQHLQELYKKHGFFKEHLISLVKKGISGAEEIKQILKNLRENPLETINGSPVVLVEDYQTSKAKNLQDNTTTDIDLPKSNVLIYYTEDGSKVAARPSGTEPKIKFYISVQEALEEGDTLDGIEKSLDERIENIKSQLQFE
ncbi:UNVERIFIED_CONTAM: hypothetical protein GTU68_028615 [Idotea baltica]|nr:hypothetical protein [Idotea baltica]